MNEELIVRTRALLIGHYQAYPKLQIQDIFKFLFQSAFGCEHLVSDEEKALQDGTHELFEEVPSDASDD